MLEKPNKKRPDILEEAGVILEAKGFGKRRSPESALDNLWGFSAASESHLRLNRTLFRNWLEISNKARGLSPIEFRDDVNDLRGEVDSLRLSVESLRQELAYSRKIVGQLSRQVREIRPSLRTEKVVVLREISKEQAKNEILNLFVKGETLYYSDIAESLRLELKTVVELCNELEAEGKIS